MKSRLFLCTALSSAVLAAQEPVVTRQVDITVREGTAMSAASSPDHRWIAIDLLGSIWVLPYRGGEARRLTPDTVEAHLPTWAPDSQRIAFQGFGDDGIWHIYVVRISDNESRPPTALTKGIHDDREPVWSHDGQRIAFSSDRYGGISTIWTLVVPTGTVHGIDASPEMIARAEKKARKADVEVVLRNAMAQALPFPDAQFDVVLTTVMLHHLPRTARAQCAAEMRRVLKPGGRVLAVEFGLAAREQKGFLAHFHRHGYVKLSDIIDLLSEAGLNCVESGAVGIRDLQFVLANVP